MKVRKLLSAVVGGLFLFSVLAGPAGATGTQNAGVFTGVAEIGEVHTFDSNGNCDGVDGQGLHFPTPSEIKAEKKNHAYWLDTPFIGVNYVGSFVVCGHLLNVVEDTDVTHFKPSCATTKGYDGEGVANYLDANNNPQQLLLDNVGWKAALGGTLVVKGTYTAGAGAKAGDTGNIVALVQAFPVETEVDRCFTFKDGSNDGVQHFTVGGVFSLEPTASPTDWNDKPTDDVCPKESGDACPLWKEKKRS